MSSDYDIEPKLNRVTTRQLPCLDLPYQIAGNLHCSVELGKNAFDSWQWLPSSKK